MPTTQCQQHNANNTMPTTQCQQHKSQNSLSSSKFILQLSLPFRYTSKAETTNKDKQNEYTKVCEQRRRIFAIHYQLYKLTQILWQCNIVLLKEYIHIYITPTLTLFATAHSRSRSINRVRHESVINVFVLLSAINRHCITTIHSHKHYIRMYPIPRPCPAGTSRQ
jgi:hypothetical protein